MNVVVETVEKYKTITTRVPRVTMTLSEYEATMLKLALEYMRTPEMFEEEADAERVFGKDEIEAMIETLERAEVYTDGVFAPA
jgi:PHD/YefM family antitoxin component YafN of YafNO toxin-antitoxin module